MAPRRGKGEFRASSTAEGPVGGPPVVDQRKRPAKDTACNSSQAKKIKVSSDGNTIGASPSEDATPSPVDPDQPDTTTSCDGAKVDGGETTKEKGLDTSRVPISDVGDMFHDMVRRVDPSSLQESPVRLTVATVCSGTDAPIFGLKFIQDALMATQRGAGFELKHLFSCEIEPVKQGFISRNLWYFCDVFRDVVEMAEAGPGGEA